MVSLRIGALLSSLTSATILRGFSSLIETICPAGTPSKVTVPPLRRPLAEPLKTMRSGLWLCMPRIFCTASTPTKPAAITASVVVPITRLVARITIPRYRPRSRSVCRLDCQRRRKLNGFRSGNLNSVTCGLPCSLVVEHNQRIDRNPSPGIDQERVDIDRGNAGTRVRDQVGEADQRLDGGSFMQRWLAAITPDLDACLGAADQLAGLRRIDWRAGERNILHQLDVDATGAEQHDGSHFGIERGADHELEIGLDLLCDQDALEPRFALQFLHPRGDVVEGLPDLGGAVEVQHHAADIGFVQDVGADDLGDHRKAHAFCDCGGFR